MYNHLKLTKMRKATESRYVGLIRTRIADALLGERVDGPNVSDDQMRVVETILFGSANLEYDDLSAMNALKELFAEIAKRSVSNAVEFYAYVMYLADAIANGDIDDINTLDGRIAWICYNNGCDITELWSSEECDIADKMLYENWDMSY